jgi:hypothetical protein
MMDDKILKKLIESDPFHEGIAKHGEFDGFKRPAPLTLTEDQIEAAKARLARLTTTTRRNEQ